LTGSGSDFKKRPDLVPDPDSNQNKISAKFIQEIFSSSGAGFKKNQHRTFAHALTIVSPRASFFVSFFLNNFTKYTG
jgi:hypothetical protein